MNDAQVRALLAKGLTPRKPVPARVRARKGRRRGRRPHGTGPREKGRAAEVEVRDIYRRHGFSRARRQPGSGAWRPYGAGDIPAMPSDIGGCEPWSPIEVKWNLASEIPGRGTRYRGEAFVRATLRALLKLWHRTLSGGGEQTEPVLWIRGAKPRGAKTENAYRVYVRVVAFGRAVGGYALRDALEDGWVELPPWFYFAHLAHSSAQHATR